MHASRWFLSAVLLAATLPAWADVTSGPARGDKVAALKVYDATGEHKEKEVDYVALRKEKPTVYLFMHQWNRPIARFLRTLDGAVKQDFEGAYLVAVWLTDQPDLMKDHLPKVQASLKLEATAMTVFTGGKQGPEGWGLNDMAHVTAVVANKGKVAESFAFVSLNEKDAETVKAALRKAVASN
jgi:hypothetical protein